jgi:hypothetical protein
MLNIRCLFLSGAIACIAGCSYSPLGVDARRPPATRFDGGQTLGGGHRNDGASTATTVPTTTVAADSGTTSAYGGQTLGAGH